MPTGFHVLDKITSGWQNSDFITIGARPAMGKTAFSLSCLLKSSLNHDKKTAFFSLEMSHTQLTTRLLSAHAEIESQKLKTGNLSEFEWQKLKESVDILQSQNIFFDDTAGLDIQEMKMKARKLKDMHDIDMINVDYMQLMSAKIKGNREQEIGYISRHLKEIAKELDIPVIALSQLRQCKY